MPIRVTCQCGRLLQLADENLGKKVRCPVCKNIFTAQPPDDIPEVVPAGPARDPETFTFAPGQAPSEDAPRLPAPPARLHEEEEPIGPRRRRTASGRTPSGQWPVTRFFDPAAVVAIIAAGIILFIAIKEMRLSRASKEVPQTITLASLLQNGPGDNAHVILTDFVPTDNYVYLYQKGKYERVNDADAINRTWSSVWVPLIPMTGQQRQQLLAKAKMNPKAAAVLQPSAVQVVVKLKDAHDKNSVERWCDNQFDRPHLQGMVVNLTDSLDGQTRDLFGQSYPNTDFSRCLIIHEGKTPTGPGPVLAGIGGGTLLIVLAGLWFICRFLFRNG
jgi:hypothetical protein